MTENVSTFNVRAGSFEGPMELLLSLIEQKKLFVNEISLAEVTNDYIAYVKTLSGVPTEKHIASVSYFILTAATLILIKSKSLLPNLALTEDEESKIVDLEKRLKLYQTIKKAGIDVKNNFGLKVIFSPTERTWNEPLFSPDPLINIENIKESVVSVLNNIPVQTEKLPEIEIKKIINLNEVIDNLTERIQNVINVSFKEFANSHRADSKQEAKIHVVVSFLAMLELIREGVVDVIQDASFGDIEINKQQNGQ